MVVGETSTMKRGNHGFGRSVLLHAYHFAGEHHDVGNVLVDIFGHASKVSWIGFLFYFFDVALVFLDDFTVNSTATMPESVYFIGSQVASIVTGCGLFTAFWLMVCDALDEQRRALQIAPAVVFVIASLAVYAFMPAGNTHLFVFYGMRTLYLLWIMVYIAARYMGRSEALRERMWRHRIGYAGVLALGAAVLIENVLFLFYIDPVLVESGAVPFFPERNFAENALMLWMAAFRKAPRRS